MPNVDDYCIKIAKSGKTKYRCGDCPEDFKIANGTVRVGSYDFSSSGMPAWPVLCWTRLACVSRDMFVEIIENYGAIDNVDGF